MATISVSYSDGSSENVSVGDQQVPATLDELMSRDWVERGRAFVRIVQLRVLDDAAHEETLRRLSELRPVLGRGLGQPRSR